VDFAGFDNALRQSVVTAGIEQSPDHPKRAAIIRADQDGSTQT
jgi:hypothetical protein